MNKAIIYARVSTRHQKEYGRSLPTQIRGCQEYADRHDLDVVATIKEDVSGATRLSERERGAQLLSMLDDIDAVVVWRLDRLSRPPEGEYSRLLTTIETLARHGVTVHDCESGAVGSSMESIMIAFFKGLAASKERQQISERSERGKEAKARAGKWVGQGFATYGYRKVGRGRDTYLEIHPEQAIVIKRIFKLFIGGMSLFAIAKLLNNEGIEPPGSRRKNASGLWSYSHLSRRLLKRRIYLGEFNYKDIPINLPHLAIIDEETWELAQVRLEKNKTRARNNKSGNIYLMGKRARCTCGRGLSGFECKITTKSRGKVSHYYYRCSLKTGYGKKFCKEPNLRVGDIDESVWNWLVNVISNDARLDEIISEIIAQAAKEAEPAKQELKSVTKLLNKATLKIDRLMAEFGDESNSHVAAALRREIRATSELLDSLEKQRNSLEATIANAEITQVTRDEIKTMARRVRDNLREGGTKEDKASLIEALDVQGQIVYENGERKLQVSCALGMMSDIISIKGHLPA